MRSAAHSLKSMWPSPSKSTLLKAASSRPFELRGHWLDSSSRSAGFASANVSRPSLRTSSRANRRAALARKRFETLSSALKCRVDVELRSSADACIGSSRPNAAVRAIEARRTGDAGGDSSRGAPSSSLTTPSARGVHDSSASTTTVGRRWRRGSAASAAAAASASAISRSSIMYSVRRKRSSLRSILPERSTSLRTMSARWRRRRFASAASDRGGGDAGGAASLRPGEGAAAHPSGAASRSQRVQ